MALLQVHELVDVLLNLRIARTCLGYDEIQEQNGEHEHYYNIINPKESLLALMHVKDAAEVHIAECIPIQVNEVGEHLTEILIIRQ